MSEFLNTLFQLRPEGWLVLLAVMLPLTLYFMRALAVARQRRQQERSFLEQIRQVVLPALDTEDPPESDEVAEDAWRAAQALPATSAVRQAVVAVTRARTLATPDLQAATQAVGAAAQAGLSSARNIPNLLMLAGLLGTVMGLAGSIGTLVTPIRNAARATEPGELADALASTMSVMQGAFGASLWGILLSLGTGVAFALAARAQETFEDELNAFVHAELVPATFPRAITSQMERMGRYLRDAGNSFQDIHKRLQDVAVQLESVLGKAGDTLGQSLTQLSDTSVQIEQVFGQMDTSVKELTVGLSRGVSDLVQAQESAASSLRTSSTELQQNLAQQATTVSRLQDTVQTTTSELLKQITRVGDQLGRASNSFEESGQTFRTEQSNYAARLDHSFSELTRALSRSRAEVQSGD